VACGLMWAYFWWDERPMREIESLLQQQQDSAALAQVNSFLRDHPGHGKAQELKGRALVGLKRWREASQLFERVGIVTSAGERAWSLALLHQQRWSEAQPLLTDLHRQSPNDAEVLHELIACNGKLGNFDEAIRQAERLAELPGHAARGWLMLGTLHNNRLNRKQAIQAWQRVLEINPEANGLQVSADEFLLAVGRAYLLEGQPAEAIPLLERSAKIRDTADAQTYLGDAFEQTGNTERAVTAWKQALARQTPSAKAREGLARTALQQQDSAAALAWLGPILDQPDLASSTAYLVQRAHTLGGNAGEAAKWEAKVKQLRSDEQRRDLIEAGVLRSPQSFWSRAVLAHRFAREGNTVQAAQLVAMLLVDAPQEPFLVELARHLEKGTPLPSLDQIPLKQF
jgi:tetratricopeptide (TPR) repeat protein